MSSVDPTGSRGATSRGAYDPAFIGCVIGTEDSTPLDFWVALAPGRTVQLDDVVALEFPFPAWATRPSEAVQASDLSRDDAADLYAGLREADLISIVR